MGLKLILNDYSSEDEQEEEGVEVSLSDEEDEEDDKKAHIQTKSYKPFDFPKPSTSSTLPSALDAFSEVAGPPEFLNNTVAEYASKTDIEQNDKRGGHKARREKKDLPTGIKLREALLTLCCCVVGIRDRVRSDIDESATSTSVASRVKGNPATTVGEGKRAISASNPDAKNAADLLRMCLHCGVPKTYSSARGMVCPLCGDRPSTDDANDSEKKKGSTIKDKEKVKRMRGQSSHATWKTETRLGVRAMY
ncbi:hypothetical protein Sjap_018149 [Stephania japonica]|uniref:Uncharacterized protein n=1 Tax=Stephania japonica TaxID=461633 RepID=A0AAP0I7H9_9MAGN